MKYYKLKYVTTAGKTLPFIYGTDEDKPNDESMKYKRHSEGLSWHDYLMNEWLESFKEICPINEEYEVKFDILSKENYLNNVFMLHESWYKDIKKGIDIPRERIYIDNFGYLPNGSLRKEAILINPTEELEEKRKETDSVEDLSNEIGKLRALIDEINDIVDRTMYPPDSNEFKIWQLINDSKA